MVPTFVGGGFGELPGTRFLSPFFEGMLVIKLSLSVKFIPFLRALLGYRPLLVWILVGLVLLGTGCRSRRNAKAEANADLPTPTIATFFGLAHTATPKPTRLPSLTPNPAIPLFSLRDAGKVTIYSDGFNPNWFFTTTQGEDANPRSRILVYNGLFSLAITPQKSGSHVFFLVQTNSEQVYPRAQVHGFQFRLNPGTHPLPISDLSVSILGNQEQVEIRDPLTLGESLDQFIFTDAYVYIPDANPSIPPNTWTEVVVWLDDPISAPEFDYITGLSIRRQEAFMQTFFLDDVQLIVAGSKLLPTQAFPTDIFIPTNVPSETPTITPSPTRTPIPTTPRWSPTPTRTEKPEVIKPPKDTPVPPPPTDPPPVEPTEKPTDPVPPPVTTPGG